MIKTLIFDFGDVFINLDKQGAMDNALQLFKLDVLENDMIFKNMQYEIGNISSLEFIKFYKNKFSYLSEKQIIEAWNYIIQDFPLRRLEFAKQLAKNNNYKRIVLSNTNEIHINFIKENVPCYNDFKDCFDKFYLSHEINLRKPDIDIYEFVLNENNLKADECLFIDDTKDNTDTASSLGIHVWNIDETKQDVVDLFTINSELF